LKPEKLIFLDETWAKTNMTRLYGRATRGKRLIGTAPFGVSAAPRPSLDWP